MLDQCIEICCENCCCCCFPKQFASNMDFPIVDDVAKEQIMQALRVRDPRENIIGVCGPGKVVRDTVKIVIRLAERDQLFQKIVTANVTEKPDLRNIQTEIGDAIGLNFDDDETETDAACCMCFGDNNKNNNKRMTTAERASRLCAKLMELQTVLVVLYDLHGRLHLGQVGIPFGADHNGCKILLASPTEEVLSNQMKAHKLIQTIKTVFDLQQ